MSTRYGFLARNISWLFLGRVSAKVCSLIALPVITIYLKPEAYGIIALFMVEASFLSGIFSLGLSSFASRMIYKYELKNPRLCRQYLGISLFYTVIFSIVGAAMTWPFAPVVSRLIIGNIDLPQYYFIYIPIVYAVFESIYGITVNGLLSLQLNKKLFFCEICEFLVILPAQIIGLIWFGFSWAEVVILQLIGKICSTVLSVCLLKGYWGFSVKRLKIIKQALLLSLPYVPLGFSSWIQQQIDKVFLGQMFNASYVGVYSVGNKLAEAFSFFTRPVMTTVKPEISKRLDGRHAKVQDDITDFFNLFFQLSVFLIFVISIFAKEIVLLLVESNYIRAYLVIPYIMTAYMLSEMSGVFQLKFVYKNKTMLFPVVTVLGAMINAAMNYWLIPRFDLLGAAFATVAANLAVMMVCFVFSQRLDKSRYHLIKNFAVLFCVCVIIYFVQKLSVFSSVMMLIKIGLIGIYAFLLWQYLHYFNNRFREAKNLFLKKLGIKLA